MIRLYTEKDYPIVKKWFESWGWPAIPESSLPSIGAINDIAAAWLYQTDSDIALVEWFVTDRSAKDGREEAKQEIIDFLTKTAERLGFNTALTFVRNPNLIASFGNNGFVNADNNVKIMIKELTPCQ